MSDSAHSWPSRPCTAVVEQLLAVALGAAAGDLDAVVGRHEAVPLRHVVEPLVEIALLYLHDAVAALAEEMVMVASPQSR